MGVAWTSRVAYLVALTAVATMVLTTWMGIDNNSRTSINFYSKAFCHETADWDGENNRVLLSVLGGGIVEVGVNGSEAGATLKAKNVVTLEEAEGRTWLGIRVDPSRHRVLVVICNTHKRDFSALAAYDSRSWELLFRKELPASEMPSFGDDVAVDTQGNAYVTDTASARIWKVTPDGSQAFVLTHSPLLRATNLSASLPNLNGIVYHPDGYLLVGHSSGGALFKVSLDGASIQRVKITGSIAMVDGMALQSSEKLVLTSCFGTKLVATTDAWETGEVTHKYFGPLHRLGTGVFVKDGKPFTSFAFGFALQRPVFHTIREAVWKPV